MIADMVYIRADANSILGSGHLMRCLSIAKAFRRKGIDTTFITADDQAADLLGSQSFSYIDLNTDWSNLDKETGIMKNLIKTRNIPLLLIDSYYASEEYLKSLNKLTKAVYVDDLDKFPYPVAAIINYNIYAEKLCLSERYPKETKLYLGCKYAPLREEFKQKKQRSYEQVKDILITAGGADSCNATGQIIQSIRSCKDMDLLKLHIIVGPLNRNKEKLEKLSAQCRNIVLHSQVSNMSALMQDCDVAISAGGTTLYELCACGIPSISFSCADNQIEGTMEFDRQGFIFNAGDIRTADIFTTNMIKKRLRILCKDAALREELSCKMMGLVDGFGADRIADELLML